MGDKIPMKDVASNDDASNKAKNDPALMFTGEEAIKSRDKIQVRAITGQFTKFRKMGGWLLFCLFFGTSWLNWNGHQAVLWDIPNRQFNIFGITLWPQDLMLLSMLLVICAFGLFAITMFAGRIWCGYTCPQTVWTFIFMWIEKQVEGDRNARIKLDKQPFSPKKLGLRLTKHALWLLFAFATAITFVGYFTPIRDLVVDIFTFNSDTSTLSWLGFFTVMTYLNAGWLREQVCIYMCPYARFQAVMFDKDTLIVSYDEERGENRGPRKKTADPKELGLGDCVDCSMCVQVCPVGIDIRDGLQYECIACAKCIEACDSIMDKVGYERGLISYTSEHQLKGNEWKLFRPRFIGYIIALIVMFSALMYNLFTLIPVDLEVDRGRGANLFRENFKGDIENSYNIRVMNKSQHAETYVLSATGFEGLSVVGDTEITLESGEISQVPVSVIVPVTNLESRSEPIYFKVVAESDENIFAETESRFMGPRRR
ncbi:cytochrome c oxidase accessory protein CcoG [Litoribrevibacter albus]|uniref:Ferredoxin n=1 Tax=Litoribrevibacter albus TaxID=1473156 RepID=A0AA37W706_9GAMM|nr:cytochrome c oxidase accessory protein CcoG [Litoribrevibacter albus]GLQ30086.1 ferredoxin [Litoribrevibacter albus]